MLDIFFPDTCTVCKDVSSKKICENCISNLDFIEDTDYCSSCGAPFTHIENSAVQKNICMRCIRGEFFFEKARSIVFHGGSAKELLHKFKYRDKLILATALCEILFYRFPRDIFGFEMVVPVPLHIRKLRKREFNQSSLIAKNIARRFKCDFDPFNLYKAEENSPQFEMGNLKERKRNVRGVFKVRNSRKFKEASVLLVDDVFTTGSTVNECARVLYGSGAGRVQVLTLTRASY